MTSPRMRSAPRQPLRLATHEIDEETAVGEVYLQSLIAAQLRSGLLVLAVVCVGLGSLPLLFAMFPDVTHLQVGGIPAPWLLLGVAVYPCLFAAAWWQVRLAERAESDFEALVRPAPADPVA